MKASDKVIVEVLKSLNKTNEMVCKWYMRDEPIELYSPAFVEMTLGEVLSKVIAKVAGLFGTEIEVEKDAD